MRLLPSRMGTFSAAGVSTTSGAPSARSFVAAASSAAAMRAATSGGGRAWP